LYGRSQYEGTGMGLAICQRIAQRHGGSIAVTSTPGQGTRFTVSLPVTQSENPDQGSSAGSTPPNSDS
jgi:signal transduction histidine kinase